MSHPLDDLKHIHQLDKADALGVAAHQADQLRHPFVVTHQFGTIHNVVYAAMGGSALSGRLSVVWPAYRVPFEVRADYHLPAYVDEHTLVIAASYSGNTEETLAAYAEARQRGAQVAVITTGGKLLQQARDDKELAIAMPTARQPRFAVFYMFKALITILEQAGLIAQPATEAALHAAADHLQSSLQAWLPDVPTARNPAKQLALELAGTSPVMYAADHLSPAAYKWKINFNENAKNVAWCGTYPEFNHNEFIGWTGWPVQKAYSVVDLRSSFDAPHIAKRFDLSDRLLSGKRPAAHRIDAVGEDILQQLVWTVVFGDFVTLYTAMMNGVDPSPVALVEKLKAELAKEPE